MHYQNIYSNKQIKLANLGIKYLEKQINNYISPELFKNIITKKQIKIDYLLSNIFSIGIIIIKIIFNYKENDLIELNRKENKLELQINKLANYKILYEILILLLETNYKNRDIEIIKETISEILHKKNNEVI